MTFRLKTGLAAEVRRTALLLGLAQTLAWASSFYLPALLAPPLAKSLGISAATAFGGFSVALVVAALVGPAAGRHIDAHGGRSLLMATNLIFAAGLALLAMAPTALVALLAAVIMGLGMGAGLYDSAFSSLVGWYGQNRERSRKAITAITLLAGFASTVGWPLTAWMMQTWDWRGACWGWAALHLVLGLPLNALLPKRMPKANLDVDGASAKAASASATATAIAAAPASASTATSAPAFAPLSLAGSAPQAAGNAQPPAMGPLRTMLLMAFVFVVYRFVTTGVGTHLPGLLMAMGASLAAAVAAGALVGPAQVGGRFLEFGFLQKLHPLTVARVAGLSPPLAAALLMVFGLPAAAVFAVVHGLGNGILTISKGTLPLALLGPQGYGHRQGWMSSPGLVLQAAAPWAYGVALSHSAQAALALSCGCGLLAAAALWLLRPSNSAKPSDKA